MQQVHSLMAATMSVANLLCTMRFRNKWCWTYSAALTPPCPANTPAPTLSRFRAMLLPARHARKKKEGYKQAFRKRLHFRRTGATVSTCHHAWEQPTPCDGLSGPALLAIAYRQILQIDLSRQSLDVLATACHKECNSHHVERCELVHVGLVMCSLVSQHRLTCAWCASSIVDLLPRSSA